MRNSKKIQREKLWSSQKFWNEKSVLVCVFLLFHSSIFVIGNSKSVNYFSRSGFMFMTIVCILPFFLQYFDPIYLIGGIYIYFNYLILVWFLPLVLCCILGFLGFCLPYICNFAGWLSFLVEWAHILWIDVFIDCILWSMLYSTSAILFLSLFFYFKANLISGLTCWVCCCQMLQSCFVHHWILWGCNVVLLYLHLGIRSFVTSFLDHLPGSSFK